MTKIKHRTAVFAVDGQDPGLFTVARFEGEEKLSRPYWFQMELVADSPAIELAGIIGHRARLTLQLFAGPGERQVHGVVTSFRYLGEAPDGRFRYRARLEPRLALLGHRRRSQLFALSGPETIDQIVEAQLKGGSGTGGPAGGEGLDVLGPEDFEFRLTHSYPARDHVVQYNETDLDFLNRTLEHHGIFYFFEQQDGHEKVVICDDNVSFAPWMYGSDDGPEPVSIAYKPASGLATAREPAVLKLTAEQEVVEKTVRLTDYNYRMPHVALAAEAGIDENGIGIIERYGDHFFTPEYGAQLAQVRREEVLARQVRLEGETTVAAFQPGHLYRLQDHPRQQLNGRHLIVSVRHYGERQIFGASGFGNGGGGDDSIVEYGNSYVAIPADTAFRPARVTPVPRLHGVMHGFVDGATDDNRADIDSHGRYKIKIPFDPVGRKDTEASRYIRMAQPYGGAGHGMHMPLTKDTEVLWTCIDGDLDRPIISGVVPNPLQQSVVTEKNRTRNVIRSVSGVEMEFNDGPGVTQDGQLPAPAAGRLAVQQQAQSPFMPGTPKASVSRRLESPVTRVTGGVLPDQRQAEGCEDLSDFTQEGGSEKWAKITVPGYEKGEKTSYLRMGAYDKDYETGSNLSGLNKLMTWGDEKKESGLLDYTDGGRFTYTGGNIETLVEGESVARIMKSGEDLKYSSVRKRPGGWHEIEAAKISKSEYTAGDKEEYFAGFGFEGRAGLFTELTVGGKMDISVAVDVDIDLGLDIDIGFKPEFEFVKGESMSISSTKELFASQEISISVDSAAHAASEAAIASTLKSSIGYSALFGGVIGFCAGAASDDTDNSWDAALSGGVIGASSGAVLAAGLAGGLAARRAASLAHNVNPSAPELKVKPQSIEMNCGPAAIVKVTRGTNTIQLTGTRVTVTAPNIQLAGDVNITGNLNVGGLVNVTGGIRTDDGVVAQRSIQSMTGNITARTGHVYGQLINA